MQIRRWMTLLLMAAMVMMLWPGVALADTTVTITESEVARQAENTVPTNNWVLYTRNGGQGTFVAGPGTPPLGAGSLQLVTPTGADKVYLFNYDYVGQPLSSIDDVVYATYRGVGTGAQVPSINIEIDFNGGAEGGYAVLVFEPVYNPGQGTVTDDTWQIWDAFAGDSAVWWSSKPINGVCAFNCFVPWSTILANNPDAVILGGVGINQGSGNPGLDAAVDYLTVGVDGDSTTYDFELYKVATTIDDCKNGGWEVVTRADGSSFKNQGDCIQYVNTGK